MQAHDQRVETSQSQTQTAETTSVSRPKAQRFMWLRSFLGNRKAAFGISVLGTFILISLLAPIIAPSDPHAFVGVSHQPPSAEHWMGTSGQGQDVFTQLVWGTRTSLLVGFSAGALITVVGAIVGLTAGYFSGWVDDLLSVIMNVVLIIPPLPLLVTLAAFLRPGPESVIIVLSVVGWAWGARVLRSQMLSLREKDFVFAALVSGESSARIIFREIFPNMASIFISGFVGATIYAIGADVGLAFLGLSDLGVVSWGTILFWANTNSSLLVGAWWTFIPAGLCIAVVAFSLAMINYAMDEITNPRLRAERELSNVVKQHQLQNVRATPVVRRAR